MNQNQKKLSEDDLKLFDPLASPRKTKRKFEVTVVGQPKKIYSLNEFDYSSLSDNKKVVKKGRFSISLQKKGFEQNPLANKIDYDSNNALLDLIPRSMPTQNYEKQTPLISLN